MSPILGIVASSNFQRVTSSYDSIATASGTGSSATISFTSIPATYTHLQIRGIWNTTTGSPFWAYYVKLNSDTTAANYRSHVLDGSGSAASSYTSTTYAGALIPSTGAGSTASTTMSPMVMDILDYANTSKNKVTRTLNGVDLNGSGYINFASGLWMNTAAITQIDIVSASGNHSTLTQFALYGIKGA